MDIKKLPHTRKPWHGHARQTSEDLIEDLEAELGDCDVGYAHVRLSYCHTAFPSTMDPEALTEKSSSVSSVQSRVDTVATASVKIHNSLSLWSRPNPPRVGCLQPIIERHWGIEKAKSALLQMRNAGGESSTPINSKALQNITTHIPNIHSRIRSAHTGPMMPLRQASLKRRGKNQQYSIRTNRYSPVEIIDGKNSNKTSDTERDASISPIPTWVKRQSSSRVAKGELRSVGSRSSTTTEQEGDRFEVTS
ncbi:hypothetical protein BGZ63DRAFT_381172 [Mariannaea sp. PMI_226]|nr:hypothetical protein BGZ63DRAFT_381172 [Mariannaea sp. PMI_226]